MKLYIVIVFVLTDARLLVYILLLNKLIKYPEIPEYTCTVSASVSRDTR